MCLLTSCAASVSLIWRISQPLTPLRVVLFVFVVAGILVGVIGFPKPPSIANLTMGQMVILAVIVAFTCSVFFKLATMMDSLKPRRRHAATGFGRGVCVRLGRGGGKVSSTGSTVSVLPSVLPPIWRSAVRRALSARPRPAHSRALPRPSPRKRRVPEPSALALPVCPGIKVSCPARRKSNDTSQELIGTAFFSYPG